MSANVCDNSQPTNTPPASNLNQVNISATKSCYLFRVTKLLKGNVCNANRTCEFVLMYIFRFSHLGIKKKTTSSRSDTYIYTRKCNKITLLTNFNSRKSPAINHKRHSEGHFQHCENESPMTQKLKCQTTVDIQKTVKASCFSSLPESMLQQTALHLYSNRLSVNN